MTSARLNALSRIPPTKEEAALVHELFVKHRIPGTGGTRSIIRVPIGDTALENTSMTHPQERKCVDNRDPSSLNGTHEVSPPISVHQKVFGGECCRRTVEDDIIYRLTRSRQVI